tara:strand:+ start:85 stop:822 length:738 start_codon:yes stop_codon:yes gene_type:complete
MQLDNRKEIKEKIENIYSEFKNELRKKEYIDLLNGIKNDKKRNDPHKKGAGVILYTPAIYNADLMLIANNPSWFQSKKMSPLSFNANALKNLSDVENKIPTINSYISHNHEMSIKLRSYFVSKNRHYLENCVGLNRFWIQTGSISGIKVNGKNASREVGSPLRNLEDFCESKTIEIVKILKPKVLWLMGIPAQKTFKNILPSDLGVKKIEHTLHPCQPPKNPTKQKEADKDCKDKVSRLESFLND